MTTLQKTVITAAFAVAVAPATTVGIIGVNLLYALRQPALPVGTRLSMVRDITEGKRQAS
jgi:hypothetical protein